MAESDHLTPENFVVYAFSRGSDSKTGPKGSYYYIGKGRPERPYYCYGRKTAKCPRDRKKNIHILYSGLDEKTAFKLEVELIAKYGRIDLYPEWGILHNLTDGGEGVSGRQVSKDTKKKISEKNRGKKPCRKTVLGPGDPGYKPIDWYHPEYGDIKGRSISDLIKMFPKDNLKHQNLSLVSKGKYYQYKRWRLLKNKNNNPRQKYKRDWYHPVHGEIMQKTISELMNMFPEENLCSSALSQVTKGKYFQFKEWRLLESNHTHWSKKNIPRNWYHPVYGEVLQKSCAALIKIFPDQKLNRGNLVQVTKGKTMSHKGWRLLHGPNPPDSGKTVL